MQSSFWLSGLFFAGLLTTASTAHADGCADFAWPIATEQAWLKAPPEAAIELSLLPAAEAKLAAASSGAPKTPPDTPHSGTLSFKGVAKPGLYQVSLADRGWIDVVQNGAALSKTANTMGDCPGLRKSVRFEIGPGPFVLQITNVSTPKIKLTIKASD
jgi:hypothetical protein